MHAFQVPRQTSQGPFTIDRLQSADMEPPEPHYFLDNPKHRLHRGFAPCVYCFAVRRLQAMLHPRSASSDQVDDCKGLIERQFQLCRPHQQWAGCPVSRIASVADHTRDKGYCCGNNDRA